MHEIKCPHCQKAFKVDETSYADILKQVRDEEFEHQLHERLALAEKDKVNALELAKSQASSEIQKNTAAKESEIQALKAELGNVEVSKKLAVSEALESIKKERDALANNLEQAKRDKEAALELANLKLQSELKEVLSIKDKEIDTLRTQLNSIQLEQKVAITTAVSQVEKERDELKSGLQHAALEKQLAEKSLTDKYETQLKDRDEAIERLKDMKARLSTKMVGESLEIHCETEFNRIRSTAFPRAYFEKDNDASSGSKGDYIFRDSDEEGTEIVSVMFEMKNESDTTATKKKNEDFFKELDKDLSLIHI